jgi:hypothetical protein
LNGWMIGRKFLADYVEAFRIKCFQCIGRINRFR